MNATTTACNLLYPLPGYLLNFNQSISPPCVALAFRTSFTPPLYIISAISLLFTGIAFGLLVHSAIVIGNNCNFIPTFNPQEQIIYLSLSAAFFSVFELTNYQGWVWSGSAAYIFTQVCSGLANAFGLVACLSWIRALADFVDDLKLENVRGSVKNSWYFNLWRFMLCTYSIISGFVEYFIPEKNFITSAVGRLLIAFFFLFPVVIQSLVPIKIEIRKYKQLSHRLSNLNNRLSFLIGFSMLIFFVEFIVCIQSLMSSIKGTTQWNTPPTGIPWPSFALLLVRLGTIYAIWYISRPQSIVIKTAFVNEDYIHNRASSTIVIAVIATVLVVTGVYCISLSHFMSQDNHQWVFRSLLFFGASAASIPLFFADTTREQELEAVTKFTEATLAKNCWGSLYRKSMLWASLYSPLIIDLLYFSGIALSKTNHWDEKVSNTTTGIMEVLLPNMQTIYDNVPSNIPIDVLNIPFYVVISSFLIMAIVQFLMRTNLIRLGRMMKAVVAFFSDKLYGLFFMTSISILISGVKCDAKNHLLNGHIGCDGDFHQIAFIYGVAFFAIFLVLGVGILFQGFAYNKLANPIVRVIPAFMAYSTLIKYLIVIILHVDSATSVHVYSNIALSVTKNVLINILIVIMLVLSVKMQPCLGVRVVGVNSAKVAVYAHSVLINIVSLLNLIITYMDSLANFSFSSTTLLMPWIFYFIAVLPVVLFSFFRNMRNNKKTQTDIESLMIQVKNTAPHVIIEKEKDQFMIFHKYAGNRKEGALKHLGDFDCQKACLAFVSREEVHNLIKDLLLCKNNPLKGNCTIENAIYFLHNIKMESIGRQAIKRTGLIPILVGLASSSSPLNEIVIEILMSLCDHSIHYKNEILYNRGLDESIIMWNYLNDDTIKTVSKTPPPSPLSSPNSPVSPTSGFSIKFMNSSKDSLASPRRPSSTSAKTKRPSYINTDDPVKEGGIELVDIGINPFSKAQPKSPIESLKLFFSSSGRRIDRNSYSMSNVPQETQNLLLKCQTKLSYISSLKKEGRNWILELDVLNLDYTDNLNNNYSEKMAPKDVNEMVREISKLYGKFAEDQNNKRKSLSVAGSPELIREVSVEYDNYNSGLIAFNNNKKSAPEDNINNYESRRRSSTSPSSSINSPARAKQKSQDLGGSSPFSPFTSPRSNVTSARYNERVVEVSKRYTYPLRRFPDAHESIKKVFDPLIDAIVLVCASIRPFGERTPETEKWDTQFKQSISSTAADRKSTAPLVLAICALADPLSEHWEAETAMISQIITKMEQELLKILPDCPLILIVNIPELLSINEEKGSRIEKIKKAMVVALDAATMLLTQNFRTGRVLASYGISSNKVKNSQLVKSKSALTKQDSIFHLNSNSLSKRISKQTHDNLRFSVNNRDDGPLPLIATTSGEEVKVMENEEKETDTLV